MGKSVMPDWQVIRNLLLAVVPVQTPGGKPGNIPAGTGIARTNGLGDGVGDGAGLGAGLTTTGGGGSATGVAPPLFFASLQLKTIAVSAITEIKEHFIEDPFRRA